jgi:hypothetical protein
MTSAPFSVPPALAAPAARAAAVVSARTGAVLPPVEVRIVSRTALATAVLRSESAVAGRGSRWRHAAVWLRTWSDARTAAARTVVAPDGVLVLVLRWAATDPRLEDYLVHELVHCVQLSRPERRAQLTAVVRHHLGTSRLTDEELYREHLRLQADEGQAYRVQLAHAESVHPAEVAA